ncbi:MAG: DNA repair protein RecN [Chitinophagales bacterium]
MLQSLFIKNYAIIDELEVKFHPQLNIITGETGAGKSILLGALNMILGKRADTSVLRHKEEKSIIEGNFLIDQLHLKTFFEENDLDYADQTIIRREIRSDGKSRAFINDSPVTLDLLKQLTEQLVDLHAQHETQALLDKNFYLDILDHLANQADTVSEFSKSFNSYSKKKKQLKTLRESIQTQKTDLDYLQFQFDELEEARLSVDKDSGIEEELNLLENAEAIQENLGVAVELLSDGEINVLELFNELSYKIKHLSKFSEPLHQLNERIDQLLIELEDINADLNRIANNTDVDEDRLQLLKERQDLINRLLHKHHLQDVSELVDLHQSLADQINELNISDEHLAQLEIEVSKLEKELFVQAKQISTSRSKQTKSFIEAAETILKQIGMPHARISFKHIQFDSEEMTASGIDTFEMLFSANKGSEALPLKKVASGGERSRLMLAVKSIMADNVNLPTMIFDEIDTGISGEVAGKVGDVFKQLAKNHQIISITHLPQIAAQANQHLFVYKDHSSEITKTGVSILNEEEKVVEIAKMLSGDKPGESALNTARELMN